MMIDRYARRYKNRKAKHLTILSLGAGVQSSTMLLMAHHGMIPRPDYAIFADTGHEPRHSCVTDPKTGEKISGGIYGWLDYLESVTDIPILRVTEGSLAQDSLYIGTNRKTGNKWIGNHIPAYLIGGEKKGMFGRTCTSNYKIKPIHRKIRELLGVRRVSKRMDYKATVYVGISTDEASRMKPAQTPYIENAWPLIDLGMTRQDCIDWLSINEYPIPARSACTFCPLRSDKDWRELKAESPLDFQEAVEFEKQLQAALLHIDGFPSIPYLHDSGLFLDQVDFSGAETNAQLDRFENECEGLCGV
jgi:hypothetical protein